MQIRKRFTAKIESISKNLYARSCLHSNEISNLPFIDSSRRGNFKLKCRYLAKHRKPHIINRDFAYLISVKDRSEDISSEVSSNISTKIQRKDIAMIPSICGQEKFILVSTRKCGWLTSIETFAIVQPQPIIDVQSHVTHVGLIIKASANITPRMKPALTTILIDIR